MRRSLLSDSQLLYLNQLGIIPGPAETETDFLKRADECLHLARTLAQGGHESPLIPVEELVSHKVMKQPFEVTRKMFDIAPDWVPLFFSNRGLSLWHGGCAWICQLTEKSQPVAFLQLRRQFARQTRYLGIYDRQELLAHELGHVGRMTFQEPHYEEILAYRTASSHLRRWLGPILTSTKEAMAFLVVLFLLFIVDLAVMTQPNLDAWKVALALKLIPLAMIAYALVRLMVRQRRFLACWHRLQALFSNEQRANAVIYRLTDDEISRFARLSTKEILHHAHTVGAKSLRWRLLLLAYFSKVVPSAL